MSSFRLSARLRAASAALSAFLAAAPPAFAQTGWLSPERFAIGATVGTDGAGGELQYSLSRYLTLRGRGTWLDFDYSGRSSTLHYDAHVKLSEGGGFADLHPFANPFVVSVGAVAGPRRADIDLYYRRSVTVHGVTFTPDELGTGGGRATLSSPAPFVGLGFDNTFTHAGHWGFKLTAGVAFSHPPDVDLEPRTGLVAAMPSLIQPYTAEVEHDIRHDGEFLAYYPQVSAGVNYRF